MPPNTSSPQHILRYGAYLIAAAEMDDETQLVADQFRPVQELVREAAEQWQQKQEESIAALAMRDGADRALEHLVAELHAATLNTVDRDRSADLYRKLFPEGGYSIMTRAPLDDVERSVERLRGALSMVEEEALSKFDPQIKAALKTLKKARSDHRKRILEAGKSRAELEVAIVDWRRAYVGAYVTVVGMYPDLGFDA